MSQIQNQPPAWEAPTGFGDTPAGFQDTDPVVQTGFTPVAKSDVETYSASITANSTSTTVDVETPAGSRSEFEPYRDEIVRKLERGLTAQRIWQALSDEYGFPAKYHSVRRYVVRLRQKMPPIVRRTGVAVKQANWYDSETHPKLQSFAPHYGAVFLSTKPYTPEHNGKVEAGVKYVKNNGLKGHEFASLEAENNYLPEWEDRVTSASFAFKAATCTGVTGLRRANGMQILASVVTTDAVDEPVHAAVFTLPSPV